MKPTFTLLTALLLAPLIGLHAADAPAKRPNILVILADDLGYADLGCQGSPDVKTPHIDSLAANGVRCTAGYVTAPQCSPSRAGLLSGQYQQRFGHEGNPNFPLMLMRGGKIIPEHLQASGYATAHFGKWHLGFSDLGSAPKEIRESRDQMLPTQHGFDESFGYPEYDKAAVKGSDTLLTALLLAPLAGLNAADRVTFVREPGVVIPHGVNEGRYFIGPGMFVLTDGSLLMAAPWGRLPANVFEGIVNKHPLPMLYRSTDSGASWQEAGRPGPSR